MRHLGLMSLAALLALAGVQGLSAGRARAAAASEALDPRLDAVAAQVTRLYGDVQWEQGIVVHVVDGDTADIMVSKRRTERVRLNEIDAPEQGAPWSKKSKQVLSDLILGRPVHVAITDWDRDARAVGRIYVPGDNGAPLVDVSREMLERGAAWYFGKFGKDRRLRNVETAARKSQTGLWSLPVRDQIPPWEWRKMPKEARHQHRAPTPGQAPGFLESPSEGSLQVNINTASAAELASLPGIGPSLAQLIILGRPYSTVDELDRVRGIGPSLVASLRPLIHVDGETKPLE
jgi:competence ComEA-like helix-hairpin-helix protein